MDNVHKKLIFAEDEEKGEERAGNLEKKLRRFYGDESLDTYMETRFPELTFTDPNAFILVAFDAFNEQTESAEPYPVEIYSKNVLNFKYENNELCWVMSRHKGKMVNRQNNKNEAEVFQGWNYFLYLPEITIGLTEVDPEGSLGDQMPDGATTLEIKEDDKTVRRFIVVVFNHGAPMVPLVRVGYKHDLSTDARTVIAPHEPAVQRFSKLVKTGSEMDLTQGLHVFPQKIQYVQKCQGHQGEQCYNGSDLNGNTCKSCGGSGVKMIRSSQEMIMVPMPERQEDIVLDLDKLLVYKTPPIELVKWQQEYTTQLEKDCFNDVFVSEMLTREEVQTATQARLDNEAMADTLWPFAKQYSKVWKKMTTLTAVYTDESENFLAVHSFPRTLNIETQKQLIADRKAAVEAGMPASFIMEIDRAIAGKVFTDDPRGLQRWRVQAEMMPFKGMTEQQLAQVLMGDLAAKADKVLWANFDTVWKELEQDNDGLKLYEKDMDEIQKMVEAKVDELRVRISGANMESRQFGATNVPAEGIDTPIDVEAEAKAKLKGTVGGISGILDINRSVASGEMTEAAAELLIVQLFGFAPEIAAKLIEKAPGQPQPPAGE